MEAKDIKDLIFYLRKFMYLKEIRGFNLGYLEERAIRSFEYDILNNEDLRYLNVSKDIESITGKPTRGLLNIFRSMENVRSIGRLTAVVYPNKENQLKKDDLLEACSGVSDFFPLPLAMGILEQETHFNWFRLDGFPLVGLDYNDSTNPDRITSRGFFYSQRTLFNYPILDTNLVDISNLETDMVFFFIHLIDKYNKYVISDSMKARDDLRYSVDSLSNVPLRGCKYSKNSSLYMLDCVNCLKNQRVKNYKFGEPLLPNGGWPLKPTQYHGNKNYTGPDFTDFSCDYLFAIRRYNGSGINSFHYLMKVLGHLTKETS